MAAKPEEEGEIESLDTLEKSFQRVISDLVTDKTLDSFRVDYEKIHASFLESHSNNGELVQKCKELNTEILSNSAKVNSILKLSQDDQRTIAGLRFEFEKAWKMVELSQERENKSRDVIDQLKLEIANLSRHVEAGGAMMFADDQSLSAVDEENKSLKREIKMQTEQLQVLLSDVKTTSAKREGTRQYIDGLRQEQEELDRQLEEQRAQAVTVVKDSEEQTQALLDAKHLLKETQDIYEESVKRNAKMKKKNVRLGDSLFQEGRSVKEGNDDCREQGQRVALAKKLLENKQKVGAKINESRQEILDKIAEKDERCEALMMLVREAEAEQAGLQEELGKCKKMRVALQGELKGTHDEMKRLGDEVFKLSHESMRMDGEIIATQRAISIAQRQFSKAKDDIIDERHERKALEGQREIIENGLLNVKTSAHEDRRAIEHIIKETEHYAQVASDQKSNFMVVDSERKIRDEENSFLSRALSKTQETIGKQTMHIDTIIQQRDVVRHNLEVVQQECGKLHEENKVLSADIKQMKDLIRDKDVICVETHLHKRNVETAVVKYGIDIERWNARLKEAMQEQCTLENTLMRSRYLRDMAESDLQMLNITNQRLELERRGLEHAVHKKSFECVKLKEKSRVVSSTLGAEADTYVVAVKKVEVLKNELQAEVDKVHALQSKTQHCDALRLELIRIEKEKLLTAGKVRALEDEMETPMMIHRWRFLEGTNPEAFQMVKMTHVLRSKSMVKMATIQRLRETLRQLKCKMEQSAKRLSQGSKDEHEEAVRFFGHILREKTKQLHGLASHIGGQQEYVDDSKTNVDLVRTQLRDAKGQYYTEKKMSDALRSKSQTTTRRAQRESMNNNQTKLIGGGFAVAVAGSPSRSPVSSLDQTPKPLISGHGLGGLVVPRVTSSAARVMPKAWNPTRKPHQPFLPTVAQLASTQTHS